MGDATSKVFKHYGTKVKYVLGYTPSNMGSKRKNTVVHSRISFSLREKMNEIIRRDCYVSESDFIRTAIREKLQVE